MLVMSAIARVTRTLFRVKAGASVIATRDQIRAERKRDKDRTIRKAIRKENHEVTKDIERELIGYRSISPELLAIARKAIYSVGFTYPGLDIHEIESRTMTRLAIGLFHSPTTEPNRIYGRARYIAKVVAGKLSTGRGAMPYVYDAERQPGSNNYATWVALNDDGRPVDLSQIGDSAHYVAGHIENPGLPRLIDKAKDGLSRKDYAAIDSLYQSTYVYTKDRGRIANGSVIPSWSMAWKDYLTRTGETVSIDTYKRTVRKAIGIAETYEPKPLSVTVPTNGQVTSSGPTIPFPLGSSIPTHSVPSTDRIELGTRAWSYLVPADHRTRDIELARIELSARIGSDLARIDSRLDQYEARVPDAYQTHQINA